MWNEASDYRKLFNGRLPVSEQFAWPHFYGLSTNDDGNAKDLRDCDNKDDFVKVTFWQRATLRAC